MALNYRHVDFHTKGSELMISHTVFIAHAFSVPTSLLAQLPRPFWHQAEDGFVINLERAPTSLRHHTQTQSMQFDYECTSSNDSGRFTNEAAIAEDFGHVSLPSPGKAWLTPLAVPDSHLARRGEQSTWHAGAPDRSLH
jgi:hypothetical protein